MTDQTRDKRGNPHWQRMIEYGEDSKTDMEAWRGWQFQEFEDASWFDCVEPPRWHPELRYRRKPRMCTLGEMEYPEPVKEPLKPREQYWRVNINYPEKPTRLKWDGYPHEMRWLAARLIQRTEQGAIAQGLAMIKAIGGEV